VSDSIEQPDELSSRRSIFAKLPYAAMAAALIASYGTFLVYMGRFLFPASRRKVQWFYVEQLKRLPVGKTILYKAPSGETVNITRTGEGRDAVDFKALSSVCPHLGCQVHWEGQNNRYFCPCHNGVFNRDGVATAGPPAEAGQTLPAYPIKVQSGLVYIEVPTERLPVGVASAEPRGERGSVIDLASLQRGPGHDPCLAAGGPRNGRG
jgi:nitrite reductase/ring-hydroxylating ferredoxin subunit